MSTHETGPEEQAAEVIGAHAYDTGWRCSCGWTGTADEYEAHVAAALAPLFAEHARQAVREWIEQAPANVLDGIIADAERKAAEKALRVAADAALTMFDPPVDECVEWSEWLRARADHPERADTYAEGGDE